MTEKEFFQLTDMINQYGLKPFLREVADVVYQIAEDEEEQIDEWNAAAEEIDILAETINL